MGCHRWRRRCTVGMARPEGASEATTLHRPLSLSKVGTEYGVSQLLDVATIYPCGLSSFSGDGRNHASIVLQSPYPRLVRPPETILPTSSHCSKMSFGFSIGDFCAISILAWKCYKSCRESSEDFQALSTEVATLHAVLKEAEENIIQRKVEGHREPELLQVGKNCYEVLSDLDAFLKRYESLATKTQKTWDRLRWCQEDAEKLRSRMVSSVVLLTAINTSIAT